MPMGEDFGSGLLEGSSTTSGIPIEHLDYGYIEKCTKDLVRKVIIQTSSNSQRKD